MVFYARSNGSMRWLAYALLIAAASTRGSQVWAVPYMTTAGTRPKRYLFDLLRRAFSAIELRVFLSQGPEGDDILASLSASSNRAQLVYEAVEVLARRGLVTAELFQRLRRERPDRPREIDRVARAWNIRPRA